MSAEPKPEMRRQLDELLDRIVADEKAERVALKAAQDAADQEAITALNAALPVRVRVIVHPVDAANPSSCDRGRLGWVRRPVELSADGTVPWVYVEDMGPGDDGCPSRYHDPRSLLIVGADAPELSDEQQRTVRVESGYRANRLGLTPWTYSLTPKMEAEAIAQAVHLRAPAACARTTGAGSTDDLTAVTCGACLDLVARGVTR